MTTATERYARQSMTLPDERYQSMKNTLEFLIRLGAGDYANVPLAVREEARALSRHYPGSYDLERLAVRSPDILQERMEAVTRFILAGEGEQQLQLPGL